MTPERWQHVKSLFERALDQPAVAREALIDAAGESPSVVAEVRQLLSGDAAAGSFLQDAASSESRPCLLSPGELVGWAFPHRKFVGARRHGRGLSCRGPGLVASGGAEVSPRRRVGKSASDGTHEAGSARRRRSESSQHLRRPRDRRARRAALHRHGAAGRAGAEAAHRRQAARDGRAAGLGCRRSPTGWRRRTTPGSCIAISSRPTSSSPRAGIPRFWILAWRSPRLQPNWRTAPVCRPRNT